MRRREALPIQVPALLKPVVLLLPPLALCFLIYLPSIRGGRVDFRNLYVAGYMVRTGQSHVLYDVALQKRLQDELVSPAAVPLSFVRPAYQALFFAPFSYLPFQAAYNALLALNLLLIVYLLALMQPWVRHIGSLDPAIPNLLLLFMPLIVALLQGQDSILLMVLLAAALRALRRRADLLGGALVALGLFKVQFVLPIFVLMLLWRRWRFCAGFAVTASALTLLSIALTGTAAFATYLRMMIGLGGTLTFSSGAPMDMHLMANLHGAIAVLLGGSRLVLPATVAVSGVAIVAAAWYRPRSPEQELLFAIPVAALVSYYLYVHDMSVLLLPAMAALDALALRQKAQFRFRRLALGIVGVLLIAPTVFLLDPRVMWAAALPMVLFCGVLVYLEREPAPAPEPDIAAASL